MILKDSYYYFLYVIHEVQREKATCPEPYSNYWDWKLSRGVSDSKAHGLIHYQLLSSAKGLRMSPLYKYNSVRYTCQIPTMLKRCHFTCFSNLMKTWENNQPHYLHLSEEETEDEKVRQFVQKQSQTNERTKTCPLVCLTLKPAHVMLSALLCGCRSTQWAQTVRTWEPHSPSRL